MITRSIKRRPPVAEETLQQLQASSSRKPGQVPADKILAILASRGVQSLGEIDYQLSNLLHPSGLKSVEKAVSALFDAIQKHKKILIVGDFDADGATSVAIMIKSLGLLGATNLGFVVPDRFQFGYGLSVALVDYAMQFSPELIVTVDNGIASIDGVARANQLGVEVIVTDHHLAGDELPKALAIVNPNQPGDTFPSKNLAGVGVAFFTMLALRAHMRSSGWFAQQSIDEPNLAELLDIVALGTVADVVILDQNNRILVEHGLRRIRSGKACPGIQAILKVAGREPGKCSASDLGFALGPRLNAAGRMEDMSIGIHCLLANSLEQATPIAQRLDQLNRHRQSVEQDMLEQARLDLDEYFKHSGLRDPENSIQSQDLRPAAMCLYDPDWHQGVIGILASRIKDRINRPVIVFAKDNDTHIKGSARSVTGVHIRDLLALLDARNPHLIEKFGGHAMAAGLSIKLDNFALFAELFQAVVLESLAGERIKDEIITDGSLSAAELDLDFARLLRQFGPWGQGFPEPLFDDEFEVSASRRVGENHLKLTVTKGNVSCDAIYFRCPESKFVTEADRVHLVYKLDINVFRGFENLQLLVEQLTVV